MLQSISPAVRRCLLELDAEGLRRLHRAEGKPEMSPADLHITMHIARCEARSMPRRAKDYSKAWLADHGWQKIDGHWSPGHPKPAVIAEAVGIMSTTLGGQVLPFNKLVMRGMEDALLNMRAKGVNEAPMQREAMLKAREKIRFKARLA